MDKQKKQIVITVGLVAVLVVVLAIQLKPKKRRAIVPVVPDKQASAPAVPASVAGSVKSGIAATAKDIEQQKKILDVEWGLDPFYHAVKTEIYQSSSFVLKGVSLGLDQKGFVFVNDQILTVGDKIAGYEVTEVQRTKVLLEKGSEKFYLVLPEE